MGGLFDAKRTFFIDAILACVGVSRGFRGLTPTHTHVLTHRTRTRPKTLRRLFSPPLTCKLQDSPQNVACRQKQSGLCTSTTEDKVAWTRALPRFCLHFGTFSDMLNVVYPVYQDSCQDLKDLHSCPQIQHFYLKKHSFIFILPIFFFSSLT